MKKYIKLNDKSYLLRESIPSDEKSIRLLFQEMLKTIYKNDEVEEYPQGYLDKFWDNNNKDLIYVVEDNNQVIAYLSIEVHQEETTYLYLDDFSVTNLYRNKGIGTSLIKESEEYAKSLNINTILLHVEKNNELAYNFYKRLGYIIYKEENNRYLLKKDII